MRLPFPTFGGGSSLNRSAANSIGGDSMKVFACASEISNDSTSRRSASSSAQARSRNEARSEVGQSSAASNNSSTCFQRSGFINLTFSDCPVQPGSGLAPLSLDSARSDLQHFGDFFGSQPAEELHLNDLTFAFIQLR